MIERAKKVIQKMTDLSSEVVTTSSKKLVSEEEAEIIESS